MLIPSASQILEVCGDTLASVVQPALTDKVAISAAQTMGHLLRHVRLRIESEGPMLFDDAAALRTLLGEVCDYLRGLEPATSREVAVRIEATVGRRFRAEGAYPTFESLVAE